MNGSFFSQIYTNGAILSIFFYFSTPFLYACVFGMGLFFFCSVRLGRGIQRTFFPCQRKRRRSYRAFGFSLRSPSGSAELAPLKQSSPFSLRLVSLAASPPDKGGIGDCCFCLYSNPLCFINPSVLRPPPLYFAVQNTP